MTTVEPVVAPFTIEVLDRAFRRVGFIGSPLKVLLTPRHNEATVCQITVSNSHRMVPALYAGGARLRITYEGETHTGRVVRREGSSPTVGGTLTVTMAGDFALWSQLLAWPRPDAQLTEQTVEHFTVTGPAETVAKTVLGANTRRLSLPVTVAPDLGRGQVVRIDARMDLLADLLLPLLTKAGIGLTVTQQGAGLVVDVYEPRRFPRVLSEAGGTIKGWEHTQQDPTVTRVVVGGGGEGVDRDFVSVVDGDRETAFGVVLEVFRDADDAASDLNTARGDRQRAKEDLRDRDLDVREADKDWRLAKLENTGVTDAKTRLDTAVTERTKAVAALDAAQAKESTERSKYRVELLRRGAETLAEGAPQAGLKVTLSATRHFRYGGPTGVHVGDHVRLETAPGVVVDDVLTEAAISWDAGNGLVVEPVAGELTSDSDRRLYAVVKKLAVNVRRLTSRR